MQLWKIIHSSVCGKTHILENIPNQDAIAVFPKVPDLINPPFICSIADGHGGKKYCFSDVGSSFAVKCANSVIFESVFNGEWNLDSINNQIIRESIGKKIVEEWKREVMNHYIHNAPYSLIVEKQPVKYSLPINEYSAYKMYGSTLISFFLYNDFLVILQLGDGDVLILFDDDKVVNPLIKSDELIANVTFSLSLPAAWKNFNIKVISLGNKNGEYYPPISCILVSTDGYSNSFSEYNGFMKVILDIREEVLSHPNGVIAGIDDINEMLPEWLNETSSQGSGDDISLVIACNVNCLESLKKIRNGSYE